MLSRILLEVLPGRAALAPSAESFMVLSRTFFEASGSISAGPVALPAIRASCGFTGGIEVLPRERGPRVQALAGEA